MAGFLLETVKLLSELPNELTLGPCEALIVGADDQDVVVTPPVPFHPLGRSALPAVSFRREGHCCASRARRSASVPMMDTGVLPSPSRPMLVASAAGSTPYWRSSDRVTHASSRIASMAEPTLAPCVNTSPI